MAGLSAAEKLKRMEEEMSRFEAEISGGNSRQSSSTHSLFMPPQLIRRPPTITSVPGLHPISTGSSMHLDPHEISAPPSKAVYSAAPQINVTAIQNNAKLSMAASKTIQAPAQVNIRHYPHHVVSSSSTTTNSTTPTTTASSSSSSATNLVTHHVNKASETDGDNTTNQFNRINNNNSSTANASSSSAIAATASSSSAAATSASSTSAAADSKKNKKKKFIRCAGGEVWEDPSLADWDPNDFRMFCGDLGNEVSDEVLTRVFNRYPSFQKAKIVRDKRSGKSKGYGFVSFSDPTDFTRAMREMSGKYVGNRPIKLKRSDWRNRQIEVVRKKKKEKKRFGLKL